MSKLIISAIIILLLIILIEFLSKKYKLDKNQKIIFWILVLYWTSIIIIKEYRKLYSITDIASGGLGLSAIMAAEISAAYGLASLFLRLPIFFLADIFNNRRIFVRISLLFLILTSSFVVFNPSFNALYISSLAMGAGATMLTVFNLMFSETFKSSDASVSASILAVAPLLAENIAAPLQYIATHNSSNNNFSFLWIISGILAGITLLLTVYLKDEKKSSEFSYNKVKHVLSNKKFLVICFIAIIVVFVRVATSVNNIAYYSKINLNMPPIFIAYLGPIFSAPQLIASVLVGTYFKKHYGIEKTFSISLIFLAIFNSIMLFTDNYLVAFMAYTFNGFGYGMAYISLISISMEYFDKEYRNISMGIFQAFFAIGIFYGDRIYKTLSAVLKNDPKSIFIMLISILLISILISNIVIYINKKKEVK